MPDETPVDPTPMRLLFLLGLGIVLVGLVGWLLGSSWLNAGIAMVVALGLLVAGGLVGLLFGIPRALQADENEILPIEDPKNPRYSANTNLEQVSDWLTKVLIGATLTQLGEIPTLVQRFVDYVDDGVGGTAAARGLIVGTLLLHGIGGFLVGYLWSRLYLGRALRNAERWVRAHANVPQVPR